MKQKTAFDILKLGYNIFLTGPAGSGKTFLLNQYIKFLKRKNIGIAITASTGIAATHMNGVTIHSWSGIGIKDSISDKELKALKKKFYLQKRFAKAKALIIDEVSMLHPYQLDMVNKICKTFKQSNLPFGGMQVILCGDFFQLPPVNKENQQASFVNVSQAWQEMNLKSCYLDEQYRQKGGLIIRALNDIRNRNVSNKTLEIILSRQNQPIQGAVKPTKLYTHNADVDAINYMELGKIKAKPITYNMYSKGNENLVNGLKKGCLAPEKLILKKGAIVMFVKNNFDKGYVNGTLGKVAGFDENKLPIVKIFSGQEIIATPASWEIEENDIIKAQILQIPLRLAWAITVHKSQGMSIDAAEIDLSKSFEYGMGYVALSRVKTLTGIKLLGINEMALEVNPVAYNLDSELIKKSAQIENRINKMSWLEKRKKQDRFFRELKNYDK